MSMKNRTKVIRIKYLKLFYIDSFCEVSREKIFRKPNKIPMKLKPSKHFEEVSRYVKDSKM